MTVELHGYEYSATVQRYADHGRFSVGAIQARDNRTDEPRRVFCLIVKADYDDQETRHALVEGCLAPALQGDEKQEVPAWNYGASVAADGGKAVQRFARFTVPIERQIDAERISLYTEAP